MKRKTGQVINDVDGVALIPVDDIDTGLGKLSLLIRCTWKL